MFAFFECDFPIFFEWQKLLKIFTENIHHKAIIYNQTWQLIEFIHLFAQCVYHTWYWHCTPSKIQAIIFEFMSLPSQSAERHTHQNVQYVKKKQIFPLMLVQQISSAVKSLPFCYYFCDDACAASCPRTPHNIGSSYTAMDPSIHISCLDPAACSTCSSSTPG